MVLKATQKLCKNGSKNGLKTPSQENAARWLAGATFGHCLFTWILSSQMCEDDEKKIWWSMETNVATVEHY